LNCFHFQSCESPHAGFMINRTNFNLIKLMIQDQLDCTDFILEGIEVECYCLSGEC